MGQDVLTDSATITWSEPSANVLKANLVTFTGDSGAGGAAGGVPAPAAGDAAASKFLKANGTWATALGGTLGATDNVVPRADGTGAGTVQAGTFVNDDSGNVYPSTSDTGALGTSTNMWADLFLASGGVINFNAGDVTVTHSLNTLTWAGASSGYRFDAALLPSTSDGAALGSGTLMWSDAFFASGGVLNFDNGDVTVTHAANTLTFAGASSGYRFDAGVLPSSSDGAALGSATLMFSDLFLASGGVINFNNGDVALTHSADDLALTGGTFTLPNTGLHLLDTNASHDLIIAPGSDLTADRTLTITTGDAARTLTISGDHTLPGGTSVVTAGAQTLTGGFAATPYNAGTKSTGTFTPDEVNGNFQYAVNGGAHTLAPPTNNCSIVIQYTNNASAGAVTTSGFTKKTGDTISTTNGDDFFFFITKNNGFSHLHVQALQ
jgi:hypothetical protein